MKIAINALSTRIGGGIAYLNRLIFYLQKLDSQNEYYIFVTQSNKNRIISAGDNNFRVIDVRILNLAHRFLYEQLVLPTLIKRLKIDILYSPTDIAPMIVRCALVVGVTHQLIYYRHLNHLFSTTQKIRNRLLRLLAWHSLRRADRVIFISKTIQEHVSKTMDLPLGKSKTVLLGAEFRGFYSQGQRKIRDKAHVRYILSVSSLSKHKNYEALILGYARLSSQLREKYKLLIVGQKNNSYYDELASLVDGLCLASRIEFKGKITDDELAEIYKNAFLFVFPSRLEGFGLPPLEAMAAGIPVIASSAPAIPEVVGDAALLFDPDNIDELCLKMNEVLTNHKLREELISRGFRRIKLFSWKKCAQETLGVFLEAYNIRRTRFSNKGC